jgi:hypothetical protein
MFALCGNRARDLLRSSRVFPPLRQVGRLLRRSRTDMLTLQVCKNEIPINETSLTNIAKETRILTKVIIGL